MRELPYGSHQASIFILFFKISLVASFQCLLLFPSLLRSLNNSFSCSDLKAYSLNSLMSLTSISSPDLPSKLLYLACLFSVSPCGIIGISSSKPQTEPQLNPLQKPTRLLLLQLYKRQLFFPCSDPRTTESSLILSTLYI